MTESGQDEIIRRMFRNLESLGTMSSSLLKTLKALAKQGKLTNEEEILSALGSGESDR